MWQSTHTFTARPTLMFNTWFGWNQQTGGSRANATFGFADAGMIIASPKDPELNFGVDGYFTVGTSNKGDFDRGDWTLREDVSWVKGGHEFHFGGEIVRVKNRLDNPWPPSGKLYVRESIVRRQIWPTICWGALRTSYRAAGNSRTWSVRGWDFFAQDSLAGSIQG